jgi:hypothetical protein
MAAMRFVAVRRPRLRDLLWPVPDDEFAGSVHLGYTGVQKTSPIIWDVARGYLRRMGSLP